MFSSSKTKDSTYVEGEGRRDYAATDVNDPTASTSTATSRSATTTASTTAATVTGEFRPAGSTAYEKTTVPVTTTYQTTTAPVDVKMGAASTQTSNVSATEAEFQPAGATSYQQKTVPVTTTYETTTRPVDVKIGTSVTREIGAPQVYQADVSATQDVNVSTTHSTQTSGSMMSGPATTSNTAGKSTYTMKETGDSSNPTWVNETGDYSTTATSSTSTLGSHHHTTIGEKLHKGVEKVKDAVANLAGTEKKEY